MAVAFTFLSVFVFRVDEVPNVHELFAVERPRTADGERVPFTRPQYEALRRETSVFSDAFAMLSDIDSRIDGRMMAGTIVTGNFFQVLGVGAVLGRTLTPADDERFAGNPVLVLSHRGWTQHFAQDPGVIGRRLMVNGSPFEVVGVMPEGFRGLAVGAPDYWAPLSLLGQVRRGHAGREDAVGIEIIGRLKPGLSRQTALAGLVVWDSGRHKHRRPGESRCKRPPRTETGNGPAAGGGLGHSRAALLCFRADPDDRLRERGEPPAGARRVASARDRHPIVAWRLTAAHHPAAAHGEPAACAGVRRARLRRFACDTRGRDQRGDEHHAAGHWRRAARRA